MYMLSIYIYAYIYNITRCMYKYFDKLTYSYVAYFKVCSRLRARCNFLPCVDFAASLITPEIVKQIK